MAPETDSSHLVDVSSDDPQRHEHAGEPGRRLEVDEIDVSQKYLFLVLIVMRIRIHTRFIGPPAPGAWG